MHRLRVLLALAGTLLLFGCGAGTDPDTDFTQVAPESPGATTGRGFKANFDPTNGVVPTATNLLFKDTADLTLNIPVLPTDSAGQATLKGVLNALDGFSTVAPFSTTFTMAIDGDSLSGSTVRMFEVTLVETPTQPIAGPVARVERELVYGVEYAATVSSVDPTGTTLVILPLAPLKPRTSYVVALTDGIKSVPDDDGLSFSAWPSDTYSLLKAAQTSVEPLLGPDAESLRQLIQAREKALAAFGVDTGPVVLSWTLTTQSVGAVLDTVRSVVQASPPAASALADTGVDSPVAAAADIYAGTLEVPYYLTAASGPNDPTPLGTWWQAATAVGGETNLTFANPLPAATGTQTIPLLASIPKGEKPADGWPVAIFQHGITSNRTALLGIADSLAGAGIAAVAIDLPLHGLTGNETDGTAGFRMAGIERTFDLDLVDNATSAPGSDGVIDGSGTHMINLASLLTTRDQGRQAVADLFVLTRALQAMDYDGDEEADFDTANVSFVGHSLGGIVGATFLALEPDVNAGVLGMPGGAVAKLLDGSATFGPRIAAGLAANGVDKGTADYESFMGVFQSAVDSTDPVNYATGTGTGRGILLFEVLGDLVVPNNVFADAPAGTVPSPTAATDPLAMYMGLTPFDDSATGADLQAWVRFTAGDHASLLSPAADATVTTVMQTATAGFLASDGASLTISDTSVVEAQP